MSTKRDPVEKGKLNLLGLISTLLILLVPVLVLVPWYKLFVLRSDSISMILIHVVGLFVIGLVMLVLGILAVALGKKQKGRIRGTWLGIVGIVLGVILGGFGGFFIIDYLLHTGR